MSVVVAHALCIVTIVNSESPSPSLYSRNKKEKKRNNEKKKKRAAAMPMLFLPERDVDDKRKEMTGARKVLRKSEKGKEKEVGSVWPSLEDHALDPVSVTASWAWTACRWRIVSHVSCCDIVHLSLGALILLSYASGPD